MNYPTKESVILGISLVKESAENPATAERVMEEARLQTEAFDVPFFEPMVQLIHHQMCHGPLSATCRTQKLILAGIMAKMFVAGWNAGRQEIIDQEVEKVLRGKQTDAT